MAKAANAQWTKAKASAHFAKEYWPDVMDERTSEVRRAWKLMLEDFADSKLIPASGRRWTLPARFERKGNLKTMKRQTNPTIGKTSSGKLIHSALAGPYQEERVWKRGERSVPIFVSYRHDVPPKKLQILFPRWTKADHREAAVAHEKAVQRVDAEIIRLLRGGEKKHGEHGPVISGGFHEDWPETLKDKIRAGHRLLNASNDAARAHARVARYGRMAANSRVSSKRATRASQKNPSAIMRSFMNLRTK
jgi:hypothetical protein